MSDACALLTVAAGFLDIQMVLIAAGLCVHVGDNFISVHVCRFFFFLVSEGLMWAHVSWQLSGPSAVHTLFLCFFL